jgi:hypothetical protein
VWGGGGCEEGGAVHRPSLYLYLSPSDSTKV